VISILDFVRSNSLEVVSIPSPEMVKCREFTSEGTLLPDHWTLTVREPVPPPVRTSRGFSCPHPVKRKRMGRRLYIRRCLKDFIRKYFIHKQPPDPLY
jgi:hypothetical protein